MKTKSNEVPTAKIRKVRFYTKASFPWAILFALVMLALGFAAGWHTRLDVEQSMDTAYRNGAAQVSLKESK